MQVMIVAGGTGGHVFPAQAVAAELLTRKHQCYWIGRPASLETQAAAALGIDFYPLNMSGLRGKSLIHKGISLWQTLRATIRLCKWWRRQKSKQPLVVMTFGGYTSVPAGIAARLLKLPLVIHEQNSHPGSANTLLAKWAQAICCGFPNVFTQYSTTHTTGNPTRFHRPAHYPNDARPLRILVLGGSLGAVSLNRAMVAFFANQQLDYPLHLVHQCGAYSYDNTYKDYRALHSPLLKLRLQAFLQRVDWYYQWCDMIICRSGAVTLAEVCAAGKTALLIPFPHATDNHQLHNARVLEATKGADIILDNELLAAHLGAFLQPIVSQPATAVRPSLHKRGTLVSSIAKPFAAVAITDIVETIAHTMR